VQISRRQIERSLKRKGFYIKKTKGHIYFHHIYQGKEIIASTHLSHGRLDSFGKSFDVGVDSNSFFPWSLEEVVDKMNKLPDNFNLVGK
jgi:predicted RNA binding protein YcfA (HicA-like mRNA interferase family)